MNFEQYLQNFASCLGILFGTVVLIKVLKIDKLMEKLI